MGAAHTARLVRWALAPPGEGETPPAGGAEELDEALRALLDEVTRRLEADRATLFEVEDASAGLVSRVGHLPELGELRLSPGEGVAGWVARHGQAVNLPAGSRDARFCDRVDQQTGYRTESLVAVPAKAPDGRVVGVLQLLNKRGGRFGRVDELALLVLAGRLGTLLGAIPPRPPRGFEALVGASSAMREVARRTARAARTDATVLLRGESGSGKELLARSLHDASARAGRPFVVVDLAAMPPELVENELFGHRRGAFTGADRDAPGRVAEAEGGTLFLDEVGEAPLAVQARLLRLLQERHYFPVGGTRPVRADVRFVCATHRDLEAMVREGHFRQDLYYRLRVVELALPPLRDRGRVDLDRLIEHFLALLRREHGRPGATLSTEARQRLHAWSWPGNVRELRHCLEAAVVMSPEDCIGPDALELPEQAAPVATGGFLSALRPLRCVEAAYVRHVLERCGGNKSEAARVLGIGRNTLSRKLEE